jgi:hypothetical protein
VLLATVTLVSVLHARVAAASSPTWAVISSPNEEVGSPPSPTANQLNGVAAVSATDVWAVGSYEVPSGSSQIAQTLIEHYDGSTWSIVPSPDALASNGQATTNVLEAVSADSASDVWAVGYYMNLNSFGNLVAQTLIEHYDGSTWSIVPSPDEPTSNSNPNELLAVDAIASNDIWAVGTWRNGSTDETLAIHFDGTAWSVASTPDPSTAGNVLDGVSASGANDVWAVGYENAGSGASPLYQTLAIHFDGTAWSLVATPDQPGSGGAETSNVLAAIVEISSSDVVAVGTYNAGTSSAPLEQTLVEAYNGTGWSVVASPNATIGSPPTPTANTLLAVAATASNDVVAVGWYESQAGTTLVAQTLIEAYDGTGWSIMASPNTSASSPNTLAGIAAVSASDLWAVGSATTTVNGTSVEQTLVEGTPAPSTTTLGTSLNPAVTGQSVTLTATVSTSGTIAPTGTVEFEDGGTPIAGCSAVVLSSGSATCTTSFATAGTHALTAAYSGDDNTQPSLGSATETVNPDATSTAIVASATTLVVGQSVTYSATVTAAAPGSGTPTGTVTFDDNGSPIAGCSAVALSSGTATCATTAGGAGTHSITASYAGSTNYEGSTSPALSETVTADSTTTSLTAQPNPVAAGNPVTYSATVTAAAPGSGTPTGTVTFDDNGSPIAGCSAVALSGGVATCSVIYTLAGSHSIQASYSGSANYLTSTSSTLDETVASELLTMSAQATGSNPSPTDVVLSPVVLGSGQFAAATGTLNTVSIDDNRGTDDGWSVTAQLQSDFENTSPTGSSLDNTIPADFLTWSPSVAPAVAGAPMSGVSAGPVATLSDTTAVPLCMAAEGSGGSDYQCSASLSLSVPPYVAAGTYMAVLDIVVAGE